jgi:HAD superfamily hydrolase (TIGR01509 family)
MKKCVIFDMDGVIIDSEPIHQECERIMFKQLGINVSDEEHNAFVGTTDDYMWSRLINLYSLPIKINEAIQLQRSLYLECLKQENCIEILPYVSQLISNLNKQGFLLALASSSPHVHIDYILNKFELKRYFPVIVSGEDVKAGKPHPGIFLRAAKLAGIKPGSCLVIEDSYNGVTAAKKAGMKCIGFINPNSGNQDLSQADLLISSFKDFSEITINQLLR